MAKRQNSPRVGKYQDQQYDKIISRSKSELTEFFQLSDRELPYSHRMSAQSAISRGSLDTLSEFSTQYTPGHKEKDLILAYYARPDIQKEMHRYAQGRYLTVLRSFKQPMFSCLREPEDVLALMYHYLKSNRWPSLHGTILRYAESRKVCDFVFEPDFKKNWAVAFGAARPIVQLFTRMGLPFFIKFSGNSSPHIIVPGEALATAKASEIKKDEFREQVYNFVKSHISSPGLLDGTNWMPSHYLRLPYSIHEISGKVSTPILPEEFDSFNPDKARIENVKVIENWWHIPPDAAERGEEFVQQITRLYPRLVRGTGKLELEHKWKPPEIPRKLTKVMDDAWYDKVVANGKQLLASITAPASTGFELKNPPGESMLKALDMLKRWKDAGMNIDLKAAAEVFKVSLMELQSRWQLQFEDISITSAYHYDYYSRAEVREAFYNYAQGRCFTRNDRYFRLKDASDVPFLAAYFEASDTHWKGFQSTRGIYDIVDNQITSCDIGLQVDFSRSDYTSAVELSQAVISVLQKYEVFCFAKYDGDQTLEIVIPAKATPESLDGQRTALQMNQIASGLNRGFRRMPEVDGNDCILIIQPYGHTRTAYSINPETNLVCAIIMPENLQDFSPENAESSQVSISNNWLDIPVNARLQTQRFLKYVLSHDWQPV